MNDLLDKIPNLRLTSLRRLFSSNPNPTNRQLREQRRRSSTTHPPHKPLWGRVGWLVVVTTTDHTTNLLLLGGAQKSSVATETWRISEVRITRRGPRSGSFENVRRRVGQFFN